jgi:hypothetical protein
MIYRLALEDLLTDAVVDQWRGILCLQNANTAGHRVRLRELIFSGSGTAAQDIQVKVRVCTGDGSGDGTGVDSSGSVQKADPSSVATRLDAVLSNLTAEPTTLGSPHYSDSFNTRGKLQKIWDPSRPDLMPSAGQDESLCILATPGVATAAEMSGYIEWEEY